MALIAVVTYLLRPYNFYAPLLGFFGMATGAQLLARVPVMTAIAREQGPQSNVA
jgi:hypothetical protein